MFPYLILILIVLIFLKKSYSGGKGLRLTNLPYLVSALVLILFAGLRIGNVGTDTNAYIRYFHHLSTNSESIFNIETSIEIGFLFLEKIALSLSDEYWSLLTTIAIFAVLPFYYVIGKLSKNILLSVFIYITLGSYLFFFNGARQGIAAAIASISLIYLIDRNMKKYIICILIAALFHRTAIIMLPFYFILTKKVTLKSVFIYIFVGVISFSFLTFFLSFFSSSIETKYSAYIDRGATGGYLLSAFYISLNIFLFILRKKISKKNSKLFDIYLNYCLFSSIIYIVVIFTGADINFIRLTSYFSLGYIFIWPIIFEDVKFFKEAPIKFIFVLIHLIFYFIYLNRMSNLVPYSLNPLLFS